MSQPTSPPPNIDPNRIGAPTRRRLAAPPWFGPSVQARLERFALGMRRGHHSAGALRSPQRGGQLEFSEHRPYGIGDDLRDLDWNVLSRLGQLHVKTYTQEQSFTLTVAVDSSRSFAVELPAASAVPAATKGRASPSSLGRDVATKFEAAQLAAVSLSYLALTRGLKRSGGNSVRVGFADLGNGHMRWLATQRSRGGFSQLVAEVAQTSDPQGGPFADYVDRLATAPRLKGLAVVLTDGYSPTRLQPALRKLAARPGLRVALGLLFSPAEYAPWLDGAADLADVESGARITIPDAEHALRLYSAAFAAFIEDWRAFCARHEIACVFCPIAPPFMEAWLKAVTHARLVL